MKKQRLKPIVYVLAGSILLAACNGGNSTSGGGSSDSLNSAKTIVNNQTNHAAFIEMVKKAQQGPANYEVVNKDFYTPKPVDLAFDPKLVEKSLKVSDATNAAITVISGAVGLLPGAGAVLSIAIAAGAGPLIDALSTPEAPVYDPNGIGQQLARLQYKVAALEQQMLKTNNIFYQSIKEQSTNSVNSAQHKLFTAMSQISFAPNLTSSASNCMLNTSDLAYHYFGYSGLGFDEFGTSCNIDTELDFMGIAKDLSAYSSDLNISISDRQSYADAISNISASRVDAGYNGDFSKVVPITDANQSALIQVLDAMFTNLKNSAPQQGIVSTNYADTIAQYNASLIYILQSAYNSLQGAYAIEHTNNYLNFLAAVNALQTSSKGNIPQISGYEGLQAVNFEVKKVTTLADLEADYVNKENNLLMLYTARTNILINTVYKYTVSDNPVTAKALPAVPTSYTLDGKTYSYEVPLRPYSEMYPKHYTTSDITSLPSGNWKESGALYTFGGYSNYYLCSDGTKPADINDKNCSLYPEAESGFYDGVNFSVRVKTPSSTSLPANLKKSATVSSDWYVSQLNMPFKITGCASGSDININTSNGSLYCSKYQDWERVTNDVAKKVDAKILSRQSLYVHLNGNDSYPIGFDIFNEYAFINGIFKGYVNWQQFIVSTTDLSDDVSFKDSYRFSIKSENSLPTGPTYLGLMSEASNGFSNPSMLTIQLHGDLVGQGGGAYLGVACANLVDETDNLSRYNNGKMIMPSYLSCYDLDAKGVDSDFVKLFTVNVDEATNSSSTGYYPVMTVYDGGDTFKLYRLEVKYTNQYGEIGARRAQLMYSLESCANYSKYCAANVK
ncbi:MAG: hypothetical protein E6Q33_01190 [Neisseriales bacterium]|nr:MAG: hypothetical protein E6Q33_01190 [Neisseriales bacterium]